MFICSYCACKHAEFRQFVIKTKIILSVAIAYGIVYEILHGRIWDGFTCFDPNRNDSFISGVKNLLSVCPATISDRAYTGH